LEAKLKLLIPALLAALVFTASSQASSLSAREKHQYARQYYHATGYIVAIWKNARRTVYSPNHSRRMKWKAALQYLHQQRDTAWRALHPPPPLPPHYYAWLCIHSHEASWSDSGDPFWGGLQFGWHEWQTYGSMYAPTADQATPLQQMWAAEHYWAVSGFWPWPNTARMCGLI
jgi:hypothetical protein